MVAGWRDRRRHTYTVNLLALRGPPAFMIALPNNVLCWPCTGLSQPRTLAAATRCWKFVTSSTAANPHRCYAVSRRCIPARHLCVRSSCAFSSTWFLSTATAGAGTPCDLHSGLVSTLWYVSIRGSTVPWPYAATRIFHQFFKEAVMRVLRF